MRIYKLLLGIILFPFFIYSQTSSPEFEHISIEQGLYQSTVNCILQDSKGLLWFGTNGGFSRYDGYSFKTYRNISSDPGSISENNITAAAEDIDGNIWIGTLSGFINVYNPKQNFFVKYKLEYFPLFSPPKNFNESIPPCYAGFSYNTITAIYCDKNEFIWIGTFGSGLFRFDPYENSLVQNYYSDEANTISSDYILSIAEDNKGTIWVATFTGGLNKIVNRIDPQTRKEKELRFSSYMPDKNSENSISSAKVTSLEFFQGKLWIGTFGGGLNVLNINPDKKDPDFFRIKPSGQNSPGSNFITKIDSDKNGNLWIGTFGGGLNKFNVKSNSFTHFTNNPLDLNSIDNNEVISLLSDKTGLIWAATFSGYGINKLNPYRKKFEHYKSDPAGKNSLSGNLISAFTEDSDGNIWIGTYNGELNKFNRKKKSFTSYKYTDRSDGIGSNYITCLLADEKDRIWIGTYDGGLNIFDRRKNLFSHYAFDGKNKSGISSSRISSLIQDKYGTIWIGTFNKGLNKVSEEKEGLKFTAYRNNSLYTETIPSDNVLKLFRDRNNTLWTITGGRLLSEFNYNSGEFTTYQIDSSDLYPGLEILSLCEDNYGNIWLGTGGFGLLKFNNKSKKFSNTENPFILRDKSVFGILSGKNNNLWISTNYGLFKYNPTDKSAVHYNVNDGVQSLKYSGAFLQTKDGEMFFGGINGFNCFYPESIQNELIIPEIIITSLNVSNKEIPLTGGSIYLSSAENSFSIYFTSTDYTDPLKNQFLFMLEGFDDEWKYTTGNIHSADYKELPPGKYIFKVKGTGSSGIWTGRIAQLQINIPVVFWKSWWFISISVLILTGIISYFIFFRIRQYLIIDKLKTKLSADLHDSIGSGLTEISLLCEIVQRDYKNELRKNNPDLTLIAQKSRELIDNMSDIVWLVNPKPNTLYDLILRLKDIYSPILSPLGINFTIDIPDSIKDMTLQVEKRQNIYLIFKEALNNTIKYSGAKNILLNLESEEGSFKIILRDDGCGFDINSVKGNGLINMKRRAENIRADLSIQTSQGNGTRIVLEWKE